LFCKLFLFNILLFFIIYFIYFSYIFYGVSIIKFQRTTNLNSILTMYTPHVPNSLRVAYRVPEPVPRTEANCEPCDYDQSAETEIPPPSQNRFLRRRSRKPPPSSEANKTFLPLCCHGYSTTGVLRRRRSHRDRERRVGRSRSVRVSGSGSDLCSIILFILFYFVLLF
jgi:hypothetical protein